MEFKVGDRVTVTANYRLVGEVGTVTGVEPDLPWPYTVELDKFSGDFLFNEEELSHV
jgi:hypothetical protein